MKRRKSEKPRQAEIPGTEQKSIPQIETAADKLIEKQTIRKGIGKEIKNAEAKLREVVRANVKDLDAMEDGKGKKLLVYKRNGYDVTVTATEKVRVTIKPRAEAR